jgi:hypothetical protein
MTFLQRSLGSSETLDSGTTEYTPYSTSSPLVTA